MTMDRITIITTISQTAFCNYKLPACAGRQIVQMLRIGLDRFVTFVAIDNLESNYVERLADKS